MTEATVLVTTTGSVRGFCAGQDRTDPAMVGDVGGGADAGAVIDRHYRPLTSTQRELGRVGDFAEGVAAFFAKRAPVFKDR